SRRRHTRWPRDWSSDVCSSDLTHVIVHADSLDAAGRPWLGKMVDGGQLGLLRRFDGGVGGDWLFRVGARGDSPELRAMLGGHAKIGRASCRERGGVRGGGGGV